jgi:pimeloyl-ACP methyl ester carboxylesterase
MIPAILLGVALGAARYSHLPALPPSELWAPFPVQHIEVEGINIAYLDTGTPQGANPDAPPLVFIHGLSSYMGFWEYQLPEFAKTHRVLALDLPGFGASGRPDAPYTPPWYASIVDSWLGNMGIVQAVLVGHSMGGQISLTMSLDFPSRVAGLVLSAPAGLERFGAGAGAWMKEYWHESRVLEAREEEVRANFQALVFNRMDTGVERLIEERVRMQKTPEFRATSVAVSRCIAGMVDYPVWSRLGEINSPTLILYGTDDKMIPNPVFTGGSTRSIGEAGQRAIPNSELVMIPGGGHTVHHDFPAEFNKAVYAFLARI